MHIDMPSDADVKRIAEARHPLSVSVYLATSTQPSEVDANRLRARALFEAAIDRARALGAADADVESVRGHLDELHDDPYFWLEPGRSLAVFATPESILEFRVPNELADHVHVSDRFAVTPLLRAITFPQTAFVLAISTNGARLVEASADLPARVVPVPDLPSDAASAVGLESIGGRSPYGRLQGSEGQKVRLAQYARAVDHAVRPLLTGQTVPLIIAAAQPLASITRNLSGYAHVADEFIEGSPDELSEAQLADAARPILDRIHAGQLAALRETYEDRRSSGRATSDLSDLARAAAFGAIATLAVDMDAEVPGTVGDDGGLTLGDDAGHDVLEEIARRTLLSGGRVLALRASDVPDGVQAAGILRYAV